MARTRRRAYGPRNEAQKDIKYGKRSASKSGKSAYREKKAK